MGGNDSRNLLRRDIAVSLYNGWLLTEGLLVQILPEEPYRPRTKFPRPFVLTAAPASPPLPVSATFGRPLRARRSLQLERRLRGGRKLNPRVEAKLHVYGYQFSSFSG